METILQFKDFFDKNMTEIAADELANQQSVGNTLCAQRTADNITIQRTEISGLGPAEETGLYDNPHTDEPVQGYDSAITQKKWTKSVQIPEAVWLPLSKRLGGQRAAEYLVDRFRQEGEFSALGRTFYDRIDIDVAYYIVNGTSATLAPTPDAVALFSVSHPVNPVLSTTYNSNYTSGATLSASTTATLLQTMGECSDRRNNPMYLTSRYPVYMLVPNQLEDVARRICGTMGATQSLPGTPNNDMNALQAMGLQSKPIVWPRLGDRFTTSGSDTAAYLTIPGLSFKIYWMDPIKFRGWVNPLNNCYHFIASAWFRVAIDDFRGIYKY
jgi:hypothetical protein